MTSNCTTTTDAASRRLTQARALAGAALPPKRQGANAPRVGARCQMSENGWGEVDTYIAANLLGDADLIFEQVLRANAAGGLPSIDVSPAQGKFLNLMVRISGARQILEIGTLGGYSTNWMAKALPA